MSGIELTEAQGNGLLKMLDAALRAEDLNVLDVVVAFATRCQDAAIALAEQKKTNPKADKMLLNLDFKNQQEVEALTAVLRLGVKSLGLEVAGLSHLIVTQIRRQFQVLAEEAKQEPSLVEEVPAEKAG